MFDGEGNVVGVLDIAQNTTEAVRNREDLKKSMEELRRSDERFRLMVDRASVGINIGDSTGSLSYVNSTLLKLLGYTAQEVHAGKIRWNEITRKSMLQQIGAPWNNSGRLASITVHHRMAGNSNPKLMIILCLACHAKVTRTMHLRREWPPKLRSFVRSRLRFNSLRRATIKPLRKTMRGPSPGSTRSVASCSCKLNNSGCPPMTPISRKRS